MTPKEFKKRMEEIAHEYGDDDEIAHIKADELLCEVLIDLGYGAGVEIFEKLGKWYS